MVASHAWRQALELYAESDLFTDAGCYAELLAGLERDVEQRCALLWHLGDTVKRRAGIEVRLRKNKRIWADATGCQGASSAPYLHIYGPYDAMSIGFKADLRLQKLTRRAA